MSKKEVEGEEVAIEDVGLKTPLASKERGSQEIFRVSGRQLADFRPTTKVLREREKVAERISQWLIGTFAVSVIGVVATGLFLAVWASVGGRDIDPIVVAMVKWTTALGTLLAAPLGFVLGHYFKSGA